MLLKDDHEEKRRKSIKRERRKVREKQENRKSLKEKNFFASNIYPLHLPNMTAGFQEKHCL